MASWHFRHTRDGGRRGLYCGMGACFDCLVTVDGQASQRACLTKVSDGQHIRSQSAGRPCRRRSHRSRRRPRRRRPNSGASTCWWSAPARPGSRRRTQPRRSAAPASSCWTSGRRAAASSSSHWRRRTAPTNRTDRQFRDGARAAGRCARGRRHDRPGGDRSGARFAPDEVAAIVGGPRDRLPAAATGDRDRRLRARRCRSRAGPCPA